VGAANGGLAVAGAGLAVVGAALAVAGPALAVVVAGLAIAGPALAVVVAGLAVAGPALVVMVVAIAAADLAVARTPVAEAGPGAGAVGVASTAPSPSGGAECRSLRGAAAVGSESLSSVLSLLSLALTASISFSTTSTDDLGGAFAAGKAWTRRSVPELETSARKDAIGAGDCAAAFVEAAFPSLFCAGEASPARLRETWASAVALRASDKRRGEAVKRPPTT